MSTNMVEEKKREREKQKQKKQQKTKQAQELQKKTWPLKTEANLN